MITLMIYGIIVLIGFFLGFVWSSVYSRRADTFLTGLVVAAIFAFPTVIGLKFEGLLPGYSTGARTGYVTKLSQKGIIFKTWEGEMQLGVGQMASLQEPYKFSIRDPELLEQLQTVAGKNKRVTLSYREWLIQPMRYGDTTYEITGVTWNS